MTELAEPVAVAIIQDNKCPVAHDDPGQVKGKAIGVKKVSELRSNMRSGQSTQQWTLSGTKYANGTNMTAAEPEPDYTTIEGGRRVPRVRINQHTNERGPLALASHHIVRGKASPHISKFREFSWTSKGKIGIDEAKAHGLAVFRLAGCVTVLVVRDDVKRGLEAMGGFGLTFVPPEAWTG